MQITTLVPAFKPQYLGELLTALRQQTVKPARIVISDDSPNQAFVAALNSEPMKSRWADLPIEVLPGPRTGAYDNFRYLLQCYGGRTELFHLLLDDDIPYPRFYERHLQVHATGGTRCVVSRRWTATESGQPLRDLPVPDAVADHPQRVLALPAPLLFTHTVGRGANWLGEFSNATFRADMAAELDDPSLAGLCYTGLEDLAAFLKASTLLPVGYINEALGYFRTSEGQHSANPMGRPLKLAHGAYLALALAAERLGHISPEQTTARLAQLCPLVQQRYGREPDTAAWCALMPGLAAREPEAEAEFLAQWHVYSGADARRPVIAAPPRVTVLIPVYNGSKYLSATLDSLLAQELTDWEALCVDDCSSDDSLALLQRYGECDTRIRVLRTEANAGSVPPVLNHALPHMRGRWCVYSSQDDLFSTDWLAKMVARAEETGADAVIPDLEFFHEHEPARNRSLIGLHGDRSVVLSPREAVGHSLDWMIPGNALWNAQMVKRLGFETFATNADEYSGRVFFFHCNRVVFSEGRFHYRQDNANAITKQVNAKSFDRSYTHFRLFLWLRDQGFAPEVFGREALKSLRAYQQMLGWLASVRARLDPDQLADAERRRARCEHALQEHRIFEIFAAPAAEPTPAPATATAAALVNESTA